jgi:hypothetical protein
VKKEKSMLVNALRHLAVTSLFACCTVFTLMCQRLPPEHAVAAAEAVEVPYEPQGDWGAVEEPAQPIGKAEGICASPAGDVTLSFAQRFEGWGDGSCTCNFAREPDLQCSFVDTLTHSAARFDIDVLPDDGDELKTIEEYSGSYKPRGVSRLLRSDEVYDTVTSTYRRASIVQPYGYGIVRVKGEWSAHANAITRRLFEGFSDNVRFVRVPR